MAESGSSLSATKRPRLEITVRVVRIPHALNGGGVYGKNGRGDLVRDAP